MQPHRVRYWLNAHPKDPVGFRAEVQTVCQLYEQAPELLAQGVHVISSDEMTGIQAQEAHLSHRASSDGASRTARV